MKTIYKYPIELTDEFEIEMPIGAEIISVHTQNGIPYLWAIVDCPNTELRKFSLIGTGNPLENEFSKEDFIGTFLVYEDALVFHLFERRG